MATRTRKGNVAFAKHDDNITSCCIDDEHTSQIAAVPTSTTVPTISLAKWTDAASTEQEKQEFAVHLCCICHQVGFFLLIDHGLENDHFLRRMFAMMRTFFNLPLSTKKKIEKIRSRHFRGWETLGAECTNGMVDVREQVDVCTERPARPADIVPHYLRLYGPNQWFNGEDESVLPEFRPLILEWLDRLEKISNVLLEIFSVGLGLDQQALNRMLGDCNQRMSHAKLVHYPVTPYGQCGVNAHHDTGFLTLLACETTPGLQIETTTGEWIDVTPPTADTLVVNLGEMLQSLTCQYFVATPHRVIVPPAVAERYAIAYFHGAALDATTSNVLPLANRYHLAVQHSSWHQLAGFMTRKEEQEQGLANMKSQIKPNCYGEMLWQYIRRAYPENATKHYTDVT